MEKHNKAPLNKLLGALICHQVLISLTDMILLTAKVEGIFMYFT